MIYNMINESLSLKMSEMDYDNEVKKRVLNNLNKMPTHNLNTSKAKYFIFNYKDGSRNETINGDTVGEKRDIRDTRIAEKLTLNEYNARKSGDKSEPKKINNKIWPTYGIPHASKAISITRCY